MLIVLNGSNQWVPCDSASHGGKIPYFAFADDTDTDVLSNSGQLMGLSCLGEFEIQTAYFNSASVVWAQDSPVIKGTGSYVGSVDLGGNTLDVTEIVGFATHGGMTDIVTTNSEATAVSGHMYVLNLVTRWIPASA
jgi:hypothetical protein